MGGTEVGLADKVTIGSICANIRFRVARQQTVELVKCPVFGRSVKSCFSADLIAKSVLTDSNTAKGFQKGGIRGNVMR